MKRTEEDKIADWFRYGGSLTLGTLSLQGTLIHSYNTRLGIVDWENKTLHFNGDKFRVTTSEHQNSIKAGAEKAGFSITVVDETKMYDLVRKGIE